MRTAARCGAVLCGLALALAAPCAAQGGISVDVGASHARPPEGVDVDPATYLLGGLRADWTGVPGGLWLALYGGKSAADDSGDWGSAELGGELWSGASALRAGIEARLYVFAIGAPQAYRLRTASAAPRIELGLGRVVLAARGEVGVGRSEIDVLGVTRRVPRRHRPPGEVVTVETDLWYAGGGPEVRVALGAVTAALDGGWFDSANGAYARGGLRLRGRAAAVDWELVVRGWDTPSGAEVTGGLALSVPLGSRVDAWSVLGRTEPDPLTLAPAGDQGGAGITARLVRFGGGPGPLYRLRRTDAGARVRFTLERAARRVELIGDFSLWEPVAMRREGGLWVAELEVAPGTYHFGFLVDGAWYVPEDVPGSVEDDWGRTNGTLVVPDDA